MPSSTATAHYALQIIEASTPLLQLLPPPRGKTQQVPNHCLRRHLTTRFRTIPKSTRYTTAATTTTGRATTVATIAAVTTTTTAMAANAANQRTDEARKAAPLGPKQDPTPRQTRTTAPSTNNGELKQGTVAVPAPLMRTQTTQTAVTNATPGRETTEGGADSRFSSPPRRSTRRPSPCFRSAYQKELACRRGSLCLPNSSHPRSKISWP